MIECGNFGTALKIMGFTANEAGTVFTYDYGDCKMSADFSSGTLVYPEKIRGKDHNTLFNAPENFVVFECVHRLIKKGYNPGDIELEKEWRLGHDQKSGRADICVYDKDSENILMIIECKTAGKEYTKAFNDTKTDGGQLFSYWQQEISAKWLVLYTSDIADGKLTYKSPAINCTDDDNLLNTPGNDGRIKLFVNAHTAREKFEVWQETYNSDFREDIIFSDESTAYGIGTRPLLKKNLKVFNEESKKGIINKFEEILRHNNVSDKENAFNRLVALFICKLVDEYSKGDDDELDFQYVPRRDTYEMLQDRLQKLYQKGMSEFMREEITYVPDDYPLEFMRQYHGEDRKHAIQALTETFRKLKYFTNNDFAFLDVHNEDLFYKNGKILVEAVQLFEHFTIVHTQDYQLLGDLFEKLLDQGFRQNEGQFFTPIPLARFIWDSLPLKRYESWPKIIDYACGAGHFLTEAIEAVNHFIPSDRREWIRDSIFGIEKDYRLARVSKVSMFMNGAGGSNIIFGDGLEDSGMIRRGKFDILTANPPYSVASFKQHLRFSKKDFRLWDTISPASSEIEVLFVERIGQLLNDRGVAAVILPSSILSNDSASYTGARQELLRTFKIRAIVKLGGRTFGATATNTVILFLERYLHNPSRLGQVLDSADAITDTKERRLELWEDIDILNGYLEMQGITRDQWHDFVHKRLDPENVPEYFRMYTDAYGEDFYRKAHDVEYDKILYYALTYCQHTTVILAPSDNAGQREFLGYYWSSRKGDEGIHYDGERGGKMYVNSNREASGTLADLVRQSYEKCDGDGDIVMTEDNRRYARVVETWRMLDFSRVTFNAGMTIQEHEGFTIESKYPMRELESLCVMLRAGKSPVYGNSAVQVIKSGQARGWHTFDFTKRHYLAEGVKLDERKLQKGDILINNTGVGTAGRVTAFNLDGDYVTDSMITIFRANNEVLSEYVLVALGIGIGFKALEKMAVGATGQVNIKLDTLRSLEIPLPPMEIQQQIVNECGEIDAQESAFNAKIKSCRENIDDIFRRLETVPAVKRFSLDDRKAFSLAIGKRVLNSELIPGGNIPVYSANVREPFGYVDGLLAGFEDFGADSVLWGIDGDFMVSFMGRGREFYPTDHCGVLRVITDMIHPRYMARILEREGTRLGFSRNFRASLDRVGGIKFSVPDMDSQVRAMNDVMSLEGEISRALESLKGLEGMKEAILRKYL